MNDLEKTIHYTTNAAQICGNLIDFIPSNATLIEPFVGDGDLIQLFPNHTWELYDIEDKGNNIIQDTLFIPPDYHDKWVITNPPYLARNKATDKTLFNKYKLDDLYKISLKTMLDADGGILIIPTNFFTDERSIEIRNQFLSIFQILQLNIFTIPVFESTTYSVCSFAFKRNVNTHQTIPVNIKPENSEVIIELDKKYNYRLAGEFYDTLDKVQIKFGRLAQIKNSNEFITHIKLYAIDTRSDLIRVEYDEKPYYGKETDRTYATLTSKMPLTQEQEKKLITEFNTRLNNFRKKYHNLSMTNYRDYNRKRIGFTFAYQLMSIIYDEFYS